MNQLILHLGNGHTQLEEVPAPQVQDGCLLIQNTRSLISPGTERMLVSFGKAGWLAKARQQPERVQQVLNKIKTDGLRPTISAVFSKLAKPITLGYSSAGVVIGIGKGVPGYQLGDRVASNGSHAEVISVPQNLVAKIPDGVSDDAAAFTVVGAIALQGIRLLQITFGETVVVIGMGLIGHLTAQLLTAAGCRVIAIDTSDARLAIAKSMGITVVERGDNPLHFIRHLTGNIGADAVVITAATSSSEPVSLAATLCRKRGRIVLTGVTGLQLKREDFYEKELSFQVSCSYGPGRYDAAYEQEGHDYPAGFVRWTEQRNFTAVLHALQMRQLRVEPLITRSLPLQDFASVYDNMEGGEAIATLFTYPAVESVLSTRIHISQGNTILTNGGNAIGIIGAGAFAGNVIIPALKNSKANISQIASNNGLSATMLAKKHGIPVATTDYHSILNDTATELVVIATRHSQHAAMTAQALRAGKHVFVEKPLAINEDGLQQVLSALQSGNKTLHVGFNRRHAPLAQKMRSLLGSGTSPVSIIATINAGPLPDKTWLRSKEEGGRVIGEVCHFIDLCSFLAADEVAEVCATAIDGNESTMLLLRYTNGSQATIQYLTNGAPAYDKERIEVYSDGRTLVLQNWRKLSGYGFHGFSSSSSRQDKGHNAQFEKLAAFLRGNGAPLIRLSSIINTTRATFAAMDSLQQHSWVPVS